MLAGAPATVELIVHAPPGEVEVETVLAYGSKPARKSVATAKLSAEGPARVRAE